MDLGDGGVKWVEGERRERERERIKGRERERERGPSKAEVIPRQRISYFGISGVFFFVFVFLPVGGRRIEN